MSDFEELMERVREGREIGNTALRAARNCAAHGINEMKLFCTALVEGYAARGETIRAMDAQIHELSRQIESKNRVIWTLNRKLRAKGGGWHAD